MHKQLKTMSLERSKFFAGSRVGEPKAQIGSMTPGAGSEGAIARYGALMRHKKIATELLVSTPPTRNFGKRRILPTKTTTATGKTTKIPIGMEELSRKIAGTTRRVGRAAVGTGVIKRAVKAAAAATETATTATKKCNAINSSNNNSNINRNRRHNVKEGIETAAASNNNNRKVRRGRTEPLLAKWLLMPQSNFRQSSQSSLEPSIAQANSYQQMQQLCVKISWPELQKSKSSLRRRHLRVVKSGQSRVFSVPSQRILLADELKQAQLNQLQPRRMRQKQQQQPKQKQQLASKTLLLQANGVKQMATSVDNSQVSALSAMSSPGISDSSSDNWSKSQYYDTPLVYRGAKKTLRLTSTVMKVVADTTTTTPTTTTAAAQTKTTTKLAKTEKVGVQKKQQPLPKRVQVKQKERQQQLKKTTATPATAKPAAASTPPKIVRMEQHKVPKTVEDGIDISYQYFVNTPVARGRKPQTIRYLYRPMVRRLNPATTTTTPSARHGRRKKGGQMEQSSTKELDEEEQQRKQQQMQQPQLTTTPANSSSSQVDSDRETEWDQRFDPPPIVVDAKYLPLIKELNKHPMPQRQKQQASKRVDVIQIQQLQQQHQQLQQQHKQQQTIQLLQEQKHNRQQQKLFQKEPQQQHQHLLTQERHKSISPRPVIIDFQPNVTRLNDNGIDICFHAPIRMVAGSTTVDPEPKIEAVTYEDIEPGAICCGKAIDLHFDKQNIQNGSNSNSCCQSMNRIDNDNNISNSGNCSICDLSQFVFTLPLNDAKKKKRKCKSRGNKKRSRK